jgi:hypothetical protein
MGLWFGGSGWGLRFGVVVLYEEFLWVLQLVDELFFLLPAAGVLFSFCCVVPFVVLEFYSAGFLATITIDN